MIKALINNLLRAVLPAALYLKLLTWKRGFEEPELKLVYDFCDKEKISIDIGAANGMYLAHLYKLSLECYAFEPRPDAINLLMNIFSGITSSIKFENVALSDTNGIAKLKILKSNGRLSTIESNNHIERFGDVEEIEVQVRRLDDYNIQNKVGFIKIDVEGHEEAVLKGALELIKRDRPFLLVEIEERHKANSVMDIKELLSSIDYKGFFLLDGYLSDIELFDPSKHQNFGVKGERYIFNFVYMHKSSINKFNHLFHSDLNETRS